MHAGHSSVSSSLCSLRALETLVRQLLFVSDVLMNMSAVKNNMFRKFYPVKGMGQCTVPQCTPPVVLQQANSGAGLDNVGA